MHWISQKTKMALKLALIPMALSAQPASASEAKMVHSEKPGIVLVHGAFADGSGWESVISILQKAGYSAIAVQEPLTSFADDVAAARRVINAQSGNVVAVGHSYGGAVISAAAIGNPHVKSLVFIAAFAPEQGEKIGELYDKFGKAPAVGALMPDSAGFLYIDAKKYRDVFAGDVPEARAKVMAVTQKPIAQTAFDGSIDQAPAWKTIPSWYFLTLEDRALLPELQRFMAKRMGATTVESKTSHVPYVSKPQEVAKLIMDAAKAVQ
jgi:pimeloyl-ACP methyl ester carboxylesterase